MFEPSEYQLLDFAKGEKLELFGGVSVRRETPSVAPEQRRAQVSKKQPAVDWNARMQFKSRLDSEAWTGKPPDRWTVTHKAKTFLLKATPAGQVGLFPEQVTNWEWIESVPDDLTGLKALNLFAYTGGTTLALASRGVEVVHIDAAKNVVKWARENAEASQMAALPVRWIVEDAMRFVQRAAKRGSKFDIIVADPPSYGNGPKKERWKLKSDIEALVAGLAEVASDNLKLVLLSAHTPGFDAVAMQTLVRKHFKFNGHSIGSRGKQQAMELELATAAGKRLACGSCFRLYLDK